MHLPLMLVTLSALVISTMQQGNPYVINAHNINVTLSSQSCGMTVNETISLSNVVSQNFVFTRKISTMWTRNNVQPKYTFLYIGATNNVNLIVNVVGSDLIINGAAKSIDLPLNTDMTLVYTTNSFLTTDGDYNIITYGAADNDQVGEYIVDFYLPQDWSNSFSGSDVYASPDISLGTKTNTMVTFNSFNSFNGLVPTVGFPVQIQSCDDPNAVRGGDAIAPSGSTTNTLAVAIAVPVAVGGCLILCCLLPIIACIAVCCYRRRKAKRDGTAPLVTVVTANVRQPNENIYEVEKLPTAPMQNVGLQLQPEFPQQQNMYYSPTRHELVDPNVEYYPVQQYNSGMKNPYL